MDDSEKFSETFLPEEKKQNKTKQKKLKKKKRKEKRKQKEKQKKIFTSYINKKDITGADYIPRKNVC